MTGEQGSLFETPPEQRPPERSMDEIAAHMAAQAQEGLTDAQIREQQEVTARGAEAAREMLRRTQDR